MIDALTAATRSLFRGRIFGLVLWPLLGSMLLWGVLIYLFWGWMLATLDTVTTLTPVRDFLVEYGIGWIVGSAALIVLLILMPTLVVLTAVFITAVIAMPILINRVAEQDYPELWREKGGSFLGGLWNSCAALLVYLALWLLLLPLWLILPVAAFLPILLNAYLNTLMFRYDALAEHATADEYREIKRRAGPQLFGLGVVAAILQLIPLFNLVSPVYSGLSFIHLGLTELQKLRQERQSDSLLLDEPQWRSRGKNYQG